MCITVAVLLVALLSTCLVACGKGTELPYAKPSVWETDLEIAADFFSRKEKQVQGGEYDE